MALWIGLPTGALFGMIQFAQSGSPGKAIFQGLFFAVFFGVVMALFLRRSWPGADQLQPADRVAVAGVVRRGEDLPDARLAPAVLDYIGAIRRTQDRGRRYRWVLWVAALGTLTLALLSSFGASTRSAVVAWGLVVLWAVLLVYLPYSRNRMLKNASHAESDARRRLQLPPTD
ncbi:MAG: hypothetical protein QOF30_1608 [Acidimicrobiaceae bacterium]|jgi:hypothetical protein|nr:hypothetical protein [Acidimicrobiaceae bacterium]